MDWFMIAFVGLLCIGVAYYIERQINDPGIKVFPFNSISQYAKEDAVEDQSNTQSAAS
ncbi:MAG TPA: hypothetical protein GXX34_12315 [Clostridia bacterium]|nr:hypothetical protein [Clostridia bacterium]